MPSRRLFHRSLYTVDLPSVGGIIKRRACVSIAGETGGVLDGEVPGVLSPVVKDFGAKLFLGSRGGKTWRDPIPKADR